MYLPRLSSLSYVSVIGWFWIKAKGRTGQNNLSRVKSDSEIIIHRLTLYNLIDLGKSCITTDSQWEIDQPASNHMQTDRHIFKDLIVTSYLYLVRVSLQVDPWLSFSWSFCVEARQTWDQYSMATPVHTCCCAFFCDMYLIKWNIWSLVYFMNKSLLLGIASIPQPFE